ncbi:hypothetical protein I4U23_010956 [Adineta vaga]|nr:hypothetical protein I4U23_010956 [Adineta vaga]
MYGITGEHSHLPEPKEIQIRKFKEAVEQRAIHETTPIPQISDEEAIQLDLPKLSIAALPSEREMRCFFHFTQAIYRNIQVLGLSRVYAADEEIRACNTALTVLFNSGNRLAIGACMFTWDQYENPDIDSLLLLHIILIIVRSDLLPHKTTRVIFFLASLPLLPMLIILLYVTQDLRQSFIECEKKFKICRSTRINPVQVIPLNRAL